jgi:hypothetical protein
MMPMAIHLARPRSVWVTFSPEGDKYVHDYNPFPRPHEDHQLPMQAPLPSNVPSQDPDPNATSNLSSVALPTLSTTTYFAGVSLSGIPITRTFQAGVYINSGSFGWYSSPGNTNQRYGIDITGGVTAGYVAGPIHNFRGPFLNSIFGLGEFGASALHNPSGQTLGYSAFYGFGFPITVAGTATYTSASEPSPLFLFIPW